LSAPMRGGPSPPAAEKFSRRARGALESAARVTLRFAETGCAHSRGRCSAFTRRLTRMMPTAKRLQIPRQMLIARDNVIHIGRKLRTPRAGIDADPFASVASAVQHICAGALPVRG